MGMGVCFLLLPMYMNQDLNQNLKSVNIISINMLKFRINKMETEKYLCICDYGQVRSVAMTWFIHGLNRDDGRINKLRYEAIAIGSVTSSKKTMKMMKRWADVVIDVRKWIPSDNYGNPNVPELMEKVKEIWEELNTQVKSVGR